VTTGLAALAPSLPLELVALALAGATSITFMSTGNSTLQLTAAPSMRGRVMSLWFVAFQGSTPIGGPVIGALMGVLGARAGLGIGSVTCLLVAAAGAVAMLRLRASVEAEDLADAEQPVDQTSDLSGRVVHGEGGASARRHAELAH
jgi:MFS family permease